jgi:hypothetical protein
MKVTKEPATARAGGGILIRKRQREATLTIAQEKSTASEVSNWKKDNRGWPRDGLGCDLAMPCAESIGIGQINLRDLILLRCDDDFA